MYIYQNGDNQMSTSVEAITKAIANLNKRGEFYFDMIGRATVTNNGIEFTCEQQGITGSYTEEQFAQYLTNVGYSDDHYAMDFE